MVWIVSANEMLERGLSFVEKERRRYKPRKRRPKKDPRFRTFKAHYGSQPHVYSVLWDDLQSTETEAAKIEVPAAGNDREKIRILVLGPPVGFPRCFDDYYHRGIEVMVSGPEVAAALLQWAADEKERKRSQVEPAATESKAKALTVPLAPRASYTAPPEEKKEVKEVE